MSEKLENTIKSSEGVKTEKSKSRRSSVEGLDVGLRQLVSGGFLQGGKFMANLPFLLFVAGLMLVYIGYGYYADNTIRNLSKEQAESEKLYSELQSLMEIYDQESLQSTVADKLENNKIYETKDPPRIFWTK